MVVIVGEPMFSGVSPAGRSAVDRSDHGTGDVVDVDEVASLPAVLEDLGRPALLEARSGTARPRPAYGVCRGMPGPYTLWKRSAATTPPVSRPQIAREVLAVDLGGGVHVAGVQRRVLGDQPGTRPTHTRDSAARTGPRQVGLGRAGGGRHRAVVAAGVRALAVDHHRRGVDDAGDAGLGGGAQHHGGAEVVLADVVVDVAELDPRARPWRPGERPPRSPPRPIAPGRGR